MLCNPKEDELHRSQEEVVSSSLSAQEASGPQEYGNAHPRFIGGENTVFKANQGQSRIKSSPIEAIAVKIEAIEVIEAVEVA